MRIAVHADLDLSVQSRDEADALILALAEDPRVLSIDYTTTERVFVPVRDESYADFGEEAVDGVRP
jgi:hypothetical protein